MQHTIRTDELGEHGRSMVQAIESCVHCGFCLPTCPTYVTLGEEMDSPRGRIFLMKSVLEGQVQEQEAQPFIDRCLGCAACVTACPSGVQYTELLAPYRERVEGRRRRGLVSRATKELLRQSLPYPGRMRLSVLAGRLASPAKSLLPESMQAMLDLLPAQAEKAVTLPVINPAVGQRRARVALLAGCVQQVLAPRINAATVRVLQRNGVEVIIPRGQGCCGGLQAHTGDLKKARSLARTNLAALKGDFDAIVVNAAGCGSTMKEYGWLFEGRREHERALELASLSRDISEFLDELGLASLPERSRPVRVAYHDACHLAHAQAIQTAPRRLLNKVPNVTLVELTESTLCCGSAGTYNIEQPALAAALGQRKAANILRTEAEIVAMGNVGCMVQIDRHLAATSGAPRVMHTVEVLDCAYSGTL